MRFALRLVAFSACLLLAGFPLLAEEPAAPPVPPDLSQPPEDAQRTASGLTYRVLTEGTGDERPRESDMVKVHYTGWTADGEVFDSSEARGKPVVFPVDLVIAGWAEGVQLMRVGERSRLWIPEELAYQGKEGKPAGTLVFDVELLEILRIPPTPDDVAEPPATAQRSKSGLAWVVLQEGTGTVRPGKKSTVKVHYTGWTTDGERFDTSLSRGVPSIFKLDEVIKGWTEGMQLMVEGETRRFWIPRKLAYRREPGKPKGMLVFEIELVEILKQ